MKHKYPGYFRSWLSLALGALALLSLASCQASPESSIVKNKDLDKLIEQAQNPGVDNVGMDELVDKYDTYQTSLEDGKLGVTVNIDARVDIPKAQKLSVLRVSQSAVTQEQLDLVRRELIGDTELYDAAVLAERTKSDIELEMSYIREQIDSIQNPTDSNPSVNYDKLLKEHQSRLEKLQAKYDSAPDEVQPYKYPSDGRIRPTSELYALYPQAYDTVNDVEPKSSAFRAIGRYDGDFVSLGVSNTENWGNAIRFRRDSVGLVATFGVTGGHRPLWREGEEARSDVWGADGPITGDVHPDDKVTLSIEDARRQADDFLKKVGLDSFGCCKGDRYYECVGYAYTPDTAKYSDSSVFMRREYYVLTYTRVIDGAPVTPGSGKNSLAGYTGSDPSYTKKNWYTETITMKINDTGIVDFELLGQLSIDETVVESSALMSFEDIRAVFEKMVMVSNASVEYKKKISIDRVTLGYALVSEANSYDTGLLIPVWDFFGTVELYDESGNQISSPYGDEYEVLTVNAIDGSIIDRALGY